MTWIANLLVLVGLYRVGGRHRDAFLFTAAGEALWTACAAAEYRVDLASICALFTGMALWNYTRWTKPRTET